MMPHTKDVCATRMRASGVSFIWLGFRMTLDGTGSKEWFCRYVDDDASMSLDWMMLLRVHDSRDATLC